MTAISQWALFSQCLLLQWLVTRLPKQDQVYETVWCPNKSQHLKKEIFYLSMSPRFMTFLRCKIIECGLRKESRSTVPDTTHGQLYSAPFPLTCLEYWVRFQRFFTFCWWHRALNLFGETHKTKRLDLSSALSSNLYLNKNNSLLFEQLFLLQGHSDWCYPPQQQELTITG